MTLEEFRTKLFGMCGLATVEKAFEMYSELEKENERLKGAIKVMHTECDTCWKVDELRKENERLNAELNAYHDLIDRIDYCYLQIDGSYGDMKKGGLAYCVADKVKYIHRKGWLNQPTTEEK